MLVSGMHAEPERARPDLDARSGIRAFIAAPLLWNGEPLGVVTVVTMTPEGLGPGYASLVQESAEHAAAAVAHARTCTRDQAQRLRPRRSTTNSRTWPAMVRRRWCGPPCTARRLWCWTSICRMGQFRSY